MAVPAPCSMQRTRLKLCSIEWVCNPKQKYRTTKKAWSSRPQEAAGNTTAKFRLWLPLCLWIKRSRKHRSPISSWSHNWKTTNSFSKSQPCRSHQWLQMLPRSISCKKVLMQRTQAQKMLTICLKSKSSTSFHNRVSPRLTKVAKVVS